MAKIMIVDDNPDISETLKTIMELEKHEAETASSGEEFLNKVENAKPDLVLLEWVSWRKQLHEAFGCFIMFKNHFNHEVI